MNANTFKDTRGEDLYTLAAVVDAVTLESPRLIFENRAWCDFVHSLNGQIGHRRNVADLERRRVERES